ncbi:MAG TPA: hypothetical protein PL125_05140 [Candidatus Omnitrophota bacterium]|nr:hypothetical protein [Candidatus Omnitrophota bacterium]HPT39562.1 hypothetical protein [Candidatus Omnitrophota bacterium]
MILLIIILVGYIFYAEFMADSCEPFFKKFGSQQTYQIGTSKIPLEENLTP